jgi:hypothetical protein
VPCSRGSRRGGGAPAAALEPGRPAALPRRIRLDDERPDRGIAGLLVLLADILRDLVEGQAIARLEGGSLTESEIERLGRGLQALDERLNDLHRWLRHPGSPR